MAITLDLSTTDLAGQGYEAEGTQPFSVDTIARRLAIGDFSSTEHRAFRKAAAEVATQEVNVDVMVVIDPGSVTPAGDDTGVHAVLSEGSGRREVRAVCVRRGSERRLAIKLNGDIQSPGIPFDWSFESTFRLRRLANGDGAIEANGLSERVASADLPASSSPVSSFGLGCFVNGATALATFGPIGAAPPQVFPIAVAPTRCDLFPNAAEKVHFEAQLTLAANSDDINPAAEPIELRFFKPDGSRVYPVGIDTMPIAFEATSAGWAITAAEKLRTGIQTFEITRTATAKMYGVKLVDTRASLLQSDYSSVRVELVARNDEGNVDMHLLQASNGVWRLS